MNAAMTAILQEDFRFLKLSTMMNNLESIHRHALENKLDYTEFLLNLTQADTVIHYDPWWNPAVEDQATDRTHRIGQDKPVFVYKLITKGTVEEKIQQMQLQKNKIAQGLYDQDALDTMNLTNEDWQALFQPIEGF